MNDPTFKLTSKAVDKKYLGDGSSAGCDSPSSDSDESVETPNCTIQPLLDVITASDINLTKSWFQTIILVKLTVNKYDLYFILIHLIIEIYISPFNSWDHIPIHSFGAKSFG